MYNIDYQLMTRLNYIDLKALIIEYDIENLEKYLRQKRQITQDQLGVEVREATDEDVKKYFAK
jgi:hypothetical protein